MLLVVLPSLDRFCVVEQKTAYEMRISDWSSDVCSSDLQDVGADHAARRRHPGTDAAQRLSAAALARCLAAACRAYHLRDDSPGEEIGRASCRDRVCQYV